MGEYLKFKVGISIFKEKIFVNIMKVSCIKIIKSVKQDRKKKKYLYIQKIYKEN